MEIHVEMPSIPIFALFFSPESNNYIMYIYLFYPHRSFKHTIYLVPTL